MSKRLFLLHFVSGVGNFLVSSAVILHRDRIRRLSDDETNMNRYTGMYMRKSCQDVKDGRYRQMEQVQQTPRLWR